LGARGRETLINFTFSCFRAGFLTRTHAKTAGKFCQNLALVGAILVKKFPKLSN